ncbi:ester cyclase [Niastella sp. OAS944]|uniref:ester cyclase n=1 Tax=Niastella sp. OAS944 TaxID=2664089 RepID=UPI00346AA92A|nr:putative ester cyclase [Chitinophagaceae bacterium OAS944]
MKKTIVLLAVATALITSCGTNTNKTEGAETGEHKMGDSAMAESKTERNKKVIMASFAAMESKNVAEMLKDCSPDCVDYGDGSMPPIKGRDSIMKMIQTWMTAFPDNKGSDLKYVADGDWVMVWGEWSGTMKGDFMGMKATNKSYKMKDVDIFKMNDAGQVVEHHNVQSPNTMMMQVGMQMPKKK